MSEENTAVAGLVNLLAAMFDGPAPGTGIKPLVTFAKNLMGDELPPALIEFNIGYQNNLFGGYPGSKDEVPSIIFAAIFGVIMLIHALILIINSSRGHYFWISYVWVFYCICKVIGFALRAKWATNATLVDLGLTSEVFLIVPAIILVSANLILAQRLFTWRHPVGGSRKLFWGFMFTLYGFVLILIGITIAASFVPYLNFLSQSSYDSWVKVVQFTSVCVLAYSLTSVALIGLSFWLPTSKDENLYTYQPWWIESFAPFYFVEKNASQKAEAGFMKRNSNHRHAIRVIAATHHHYKVVKGVSNQRGDLKHNVSIMILIATTILIFIGAIGRAIVVFQYRYNKDASKAAEPWFMYICWGIFEIIINFIYIIGRVDLRFYRPDILPQAVRAIVTAEQTYYPSSDEEEEGFHRDRPETYHVLKEKNPNPNEVINIQAQGVTSVPPQQRRPADHDGFESGDWEFASPVGKISATSSESKNAAAPENDKTAHDFKF